MTFEKDDSEDSLAFRANGGEVECVADLTPGLRPLSECLSCESEGGSGGSDLLLLPASNQGLCVLLGVLINFTWSHLSNLFTFLLLFFQGRPSRVFRYYSSPIFFLRSSFLTASLRADCLVHLNSPFLPGIFPVPRDTCFKKTLFYFFK